jgi:hypothetical protein
MTPCRTGIVDLPHTRRIEAPRWPTSESRPLRPSARSSWASDSARASHLRGSLRRKDAGSPRCRRATCGSHGHTAACGARRARLVAAEANPIIVSRQRTVSRSALARPVRLPALSVGRPSLNDLPARRRITAASGEFARFFSAPQRARGCDVTRCAHCFSQPFWSLQSQRQAILPVRAGKPFPRGVPWSCQNLALVRGRWSVSTLFLRQKAPFGIPKTSILSIFRKCTLTPSSCIFAAIVRIRRPRRWRRSELNSAGGSGLWGGFRWWCQHCTCCTQRHAMLISIASIPWRGQRVWVHH